MRHIVELNYNHVKQPYKSKPYSALLEDMGLFSPAGTPLFWSATIRNLPDVDPETSSLTAYTLLPNTTLHIASRWSPALDTITYVLSGHSKSGRFGPLYECSDFRELMEASLTNLCAKRDRFSDQRIAAHTRFIACYMGYVHTFERKLMRSPKVSKLCNITPPHQDPQVGLVVDLSDLLSTTHIREFRGEGWYQAEASDGRPTTVLVTRATTGKWSYTIWVGPSPWDVMSATLALPIHCSTRGKIAPTPRS